MDSRLQIQDKFRRLSKESIELAWALGPLYAEKGVLTLTKWGFESFGQWIMEDICNPDDPSRCFVSRSYAYELGSVGKTFYLYRNRIDELAGQNKIGIRRLIDLTSKIQQGTSLQDIENHLYLNQPLPWEEEAKTPQSDPERLIPYQVLVRKGDLGNFHLSLFLHALLAGNKDVHSAASDIILAELPRLLSQNLGQYERFRPWIMDGTFRCKLCKKVPVEPTIHHVLPVSLGFQYGPQVILCARPCHYDKVQPKWKRYCKAWGWDVDDLKAAVDEQIKQHGKIIDQGPYEVFKGLEA